MSEYHVDRDTNYMMKNWNTTCLVTDYGVLKKEIDLEILQKQIPNVIKLQNTEKPKENL